MSARKEITENVFGATLTRRKFVKGGGALLVGLSIPAAFTAASGTAAPAVRVVARDPSR
jgi:hypothetical protein